MKKVDILGSPPVAFTESYNQYINIPAAVGDILCPKNTPNYIIGHHSSRILRGLHDIGGDSHIIKTREDDQGTIWQKAFYDKAKKHPRFQAMYYWFLAEHARSIMGPRFVYQKIPTLRVMYPGSLAVGEWHCDTEYGHYDAEVNFVIPITHMIGTSALIVEESTGRRMLEGAPGDYIVFDGANCPHGNVVNDTNHTRVSMDFRCITEDDWADIEDWLSFNEGAASINSDLKFNVGSSGCYYKRWEW